MTIGQELELGREYKPEELSSLGVRPTRMLEGDRFPQNTFTYSRRGEIYVVIEGSNCLIPVEYYNPETGIFRKRGEQR